MLSFSDLPVELKLRILEELFFDTSEALLEDSTSAKQLTFVGRGMHSVHYYQTRRKIMPLACTSKEFLLEIRNLTDILRESMSSRAAELEKRHLQQPCVDRGSNRRRIIPLTGASGGLCDICKNIKNVRDQSYYLEDVGRVLECIRGSLVISCLPCICGGHGRHQRSSLVYTGGTLMWHGLELTIPKDHFGHRWCGCPEATQKTGASESSLSTK